MFWGVNLCNGSFRKPSTGFNKQVVSAIWYTRAFDLFVETRLRKHNKHRGDKTAEDSQPVAMAKYAPDRVIKTTALFYDNDRMIAHYHPTQKTLSILIVFTRVDGSKFQIP